MHDCVGVIIGGVQHTDGPLQVKYWGGGPDPCDPCGVDAYVHLQIRIAHCHRNTGR